MFSSNASNTHQQISTETVLAKRHKSPTLLGEIPSHQNHQIVVVVSSSIASSCWSCSLIGSKWSAWRNPAVGRKNLSLHLPWAMATRPSATHLMYLSIHLNSWLLHKRYPCYLSSKNLLSRNFGHFSYPKSSKSWIILVVKALVLLHHSKNPPNGLSDHHPKVLDNWIEPRKIHRWRGVANLERSPASRVMTRIFFV